MTLSLVGTSVTDGVEGQLRNMYLMRKLLKIPEEMVGRFLRLYGNPDEWGSLCSGCSGLVQEGGTLYEEICRLKKRQDDVRKLVRMRMKVKMELHEDKDPHC